MTTYQFINVDGEWYYDVNADGEIDEAEMDKRDIESSYYYPEIIFLGDGRVAMQMEITLNYTEEDDVNTYYGWPAKGSLAINIFYTPPFANYHYFCYNKKRLRERRQHVTYWRNVEENK